MVIFLQMIPWYDRIIKDSYQENIATDMRR
jgi:hypothetical protein